MTPNDQRPTRVLVAEDNPTSAAILVRSLRKADYEVIAATDGFQAVTLATEQQPDAILLDMMMPGRSGIESCKILKSQESTKHIPIIFVTAVSETKQILRAFEAGGCDYVTKPFRTAEVLARVSTHIRIRRAEKELSEKKKETVELARQLAEANVDLALLGRIDSLTKLFNRRAWEEAADYEQERFKQDDHPYCILMLDIDQFKGYNDSRGHQAGDACLRRVVDAVVSSCESKDIVARFGGEEFVILAADTTMKRGMQLAESIREAVWNLGIPHSGSSIDGRVTISIGVACASDSWEKTLSAADEALYVAKRAGRNMVYGSGHATIEIESQRGAGPAICTTSTADSIPFEIAGEKVAVGAAPSDECQQTVLVVDDEPTSRAVLKGCLKHDGYLILEATDGEEALLCVARRPPDVIIMDVAMPRLGGIECTRRLKADPDTKDIPVIMLSGRSDGDDIVAGLRAGADEYINKPIHRSELVLRVRSMLRAHQERKELLRSYRSCGLQAHTLGLLLGFSHDLAQADDLDTVLRKCSEVATKLTRCRRIAIMLPDQENRFLRIGGAVGIADDVVRRFKAPMNASLAGKVFQTRRSLIINSEDEAKNLRHQAEAGLAGVSEYNTQIFSGVPLVCTPMCAMDQTVGVLAISDRVDGHDFTSAELENIIFICDATATSIHDVIARRKRDDAYDSIVVALAKLAEHRDNDAGGHLERVTRFSVMLAEDLGSTDRCAAQIDENFLRCLERAVPLHDIGKVAIPDHILLKPDQLTSSEWKIMKTHTEIGAETICSVLQRAPGVPFLTMAEEITRYHHEWYDGSGYPAGLEGDGIPLSARIVAVADVYDALTSERVYKRVFSHDEATSIILESSGTQFDPAIVEAFRRREVELKNVNAELADSASANHRKTLAAAPQSAAV